MEFRNIRTFLQVTESGSFTAAAASLGYTQSTVSIQIRQLEEEIGVPLFDRINHSVYLTEAGRLFLQHALRFDHNMHDLLESFRNPAEPQGEIRMISSDSICEKMMLLNYHEFYSAFPKIRLIFTTSDTREMLSILDRHEADVAFTLDTHVFREEYVIAHESKVPLHFVTNPGSEAARKKDFKLTDLLEYPILLTEKNLSYRRVLDSFLAERSLHISPVLETGRTDILANAVTRGNFITFLPDFVTEDMVQAGRLVRLEPEGHEFSIWKQLIYRKDKWVSHSMRAFLDFVIDHEFRW